MSNLLRVAVSKQKRRYQKNGFDLDLAYITDNIIAMGFPSEKVEGVFRNPMKDVQRFLDQYHKDHYKVYNLCSERVYDHSKFYGRVGYYPFDDHNAPQFELIESFCKDVDNWMKEDEKNVAVIHCKAGKGRTGLMICCWLMYCGMWKNTEDSLRFYAALRTYNQKGVTIPSQIRYVHYFGKSLREQIKYVPRTVLLRKIMLKPLPKEINHSEIQFNISVGKTTVFTSKDSLNVFIHKSEKKKKEKLPKESKKEKKEKKLQKENSEAKLEHSPSMQSVNGAASLSSSTNNAGMNTISSQTLSQLGGSQFSLSDLAGDSVSTSDEYIAFEIGSLPLLGDIRIEFTDKNGDRMFMFWINTSFVQQHEMIPKIGLDKAHKDKNHKSYPEDFHVELFFEQLEPSHTTVVASAEEHLQHQQVYNNNNIANSSSHNEIDNSNNSNNNKNNINNNNNNNTSTNNNSSNATDIDNNNNSNINLNSSNNNISLSSSQVKPIDNSITTTEKKDQNQEQVPPTKVEAEKVENSNASANDSETPSDTSSNTSN